MAEKCKSHADSSTPRMSFFRILKFRRNRTRCSHEHVIVDCTLKSPGVKNISWHCPFDKALLTIFCVCVSCAVFLVHVLHVMKFRHLYHNYIIFQTFAVLKLSGTNFKIVFRDLALIFTAPCSLYFFKGCWPTLII